MSKKSHYSLVVAKFGGTSVANFDSMNTSANIIADNSSIRLVVLSASAGVTDILIKLLRKNRHKQYDYYLNKIRQIQYCIINRLVNKLIIRKKIDQMIDNINYIVNISATTMSSALYDELISYGELMSTLLFVEVLRQRNINATWFDIRAIMRTNDHFGCAKPDNYIIKKKTKTILLPYLTNNIVITQGFIGSEINGRTTTLGRGGSDYTVTLLGEALNADRIDIWTDVAGIYTTDPKIVPEAKRIDAISFEEAAEMAIFGAKILHPATLIPAMRKKIPVFIGCSQNSYAGGTLIYNQINNKPLFRALTLSQNQILLILHSLNMMYNRSFLVKIFNILTKYAIPINLITTSKVSITLTIDTNINVAVKNLNTLIQTMLTELSFLCRIELEENIALIALIGNKLSNIYGINKKIFNTLDIFNIKLIYYGTSSHNICLLVSNKDAEKIVKILHDTFFK